MIERKYRLRNIYQGQIYLLWAQMFCLKEMLTRHGAIRLQYSVYEVNNTRRILDNIKLQIQEKYGRLFTPDDSVVIFEVSNTNVIKYGNAIHRDKDIVYF